MKTVTHFDLSTYLSFRMGPIIDTVFIIEKDQEIEDILHLYPNASILGGGTNTLVGKEKAQDVWLINQMMGWQMESETVQGVRIRIQSGQNMDAFIQWSVENGYQGMESLSGIPGSLGGAAMMNAGAYGGEMKQVLTEVTVLTREGELRRIPSEELKLGYRYSVIPEKGWIVLEAKLKLHRGDYDMIKARMDELKEKRVEKQPLELPSAGSTFKRPEGYFAGKLIMDAGLRGFSVGGAQVSEKHCGFVVNTGEATAKDVRDLIREVSRQVKTKFGVELEPEVKMLGEF